MGTVNKKIADDIIAGKYADDNATRIVKYTNAWGGESYGVTFGRENKGKYLTETDYIRDPKIYWEKGEPHARF